MHYFRIKLKKKTFLWERDTPPPQTTPFGAYVASTLRLDAFGVSRPLIIKILDPPLAYIYVSIPVLPCPD